jgi:hypothetical protein
VSLKFEITKLQEEHNSLSGRHEHLQLEQMRHDQYPRWQFSHVEQRRHAQFGAARRLHELGCVSVKSADVQLLTRAILSAKSARETQRLSALGDLPVSHSTFNIGRPCSPPHPCCYWRKTQLRKNVWAVYLILSRSLFTLFGRTSERIRISRRRRSRARVEISGRL